MIDAINSIKPCDITAEMILSFGAFKKHGFPCDLIDAADSKIRQHYIAIMKKQEQVLSGPMVRYSPNESVPLCYSY